LPVKVANVPDDIAAKRAQFGLDKANNTIAAGKTPLPVAVVGTVPVDLAGKRTMFAKMNPTGALAPIKPAYDPLSSIRVQATTINVPPPPVVNVAPPAVTVDNQMHADIKASFSLDGVVRELVGKIESAILSSIRIPTSSAGTDGRANHMPPDSYNF
jgi:hypothetical protein